MKISILASGSSGNCIYLGSDDTSILIDIGISAKRTQENLIKIGISPENLDAIIITHEHTDHIKGLSVFTRRWHTPVYMTEATYSEVAYRVLPKKIPKVNYITCGESFNIGDLELLPFNTPHDAIDPCGYIINNDGLSVGIATDLGQMTHLVRERLRGCSALILEANHDLDMLLNGIYPWYLKQRVKGRNGHLSNEAMGDALKELAHKDLQAVFLAHISKENNNPKLAQKQAELALKASGFNNVKVFITYQNKITPILELINYAQIK